jgi:hypothetical protein
LQRDICDVLEKYAKWRATAQDLEKFKRAILQTVIHVPSASLPVKQLNEEPGRQQNGNGYRYGERHVHFEE